MGDGVFSWIKLALGIGNEVIKAARAGKTTIRVEDVIPEEWRDRVLLEELETRAREDYQDE